jgi:outer membrane protein assembly factor BamD
VFPGKVRFILILAGIALLSSCSQYRKMTKTKDIDAKLDYAIKLYKKGDYYKALPLLEELITVYRGTKKAEQTYYYYSYTNYQLEDYQTAAYDFDNYVKTFPNSEYAEECAFMKAYCYYQDSPNYSLDQTSTVKAINEFQLFIDQHLYSSRIAECNRLIDELRLKLETKDYENAKLYYHMEDYKAALTSFENLLNGFPSTKYREETMFLIVKSSYLLAENSIASKKNDRYNFALTAYGEFALAYPESKYAKEANSIKENCRKRLEKYSASIQ